MDSCLSYYSALSLAWLSWEIWSKRSFSCWRRDYWAYWVMLSQRRDSMGVVVGEWAIGVGG
jgi:hypothetical protein